MTTQSYLIIENNVVSNEVIWDGNTQTWTPPADSIQLIASSTPAMVWQPIFTDEKITDWVLEEVIGAGGIGFTWNGTVVTTNEPKPEIQVIIE
jgi:hypothetical protein